MKKNIKDKKGDRNVEVGNDGNSRQQKQCDFDIKSTTSDDKFIAEESYQKEETSDFAIDLVSIKNPGADGFETEEDI